MDLGVTGIDDERKDDIIKTLSSTNFVFWVKDKIKFPNKIDTIREIDSNKMEIVFGTENEDKPTVDELVEDFTVSAISL
jgi:hypothetical protein